MLREEVLLFPPFQGGFFIATTVVIDIHITKYIENISQFLRLSIDTSSTKGSGHRYMLMSYDHMSQPDSIIFCVDQSDDFVIRALSKFSVIKCRK